LASLPHPHFLAEIKAARWKPFQKSTLSLIPALLVIQALRWLRSEPEEIINNEITPLTDITPGK
jgi:hypothetical protein